MKLHLRDLFWLVLVCGLAVGWWVRELHHQEELKRSQEITQSFSESCDRMTRLLAGEGYVVEWNTGKVHASKSR